MKKLFNTIILACLLFGALKSNSYGALHSDINLIEITPDKLTQIIPDGNYDEFRKNLKLEIDECKRSGRKQKISIQTATNSKKTFKTSEWCIETGTDLLKILNEFSNFKDAYEKIKTEFRWFKSIGNDGQGTIQFTGYYSPVLKGSRVKTNQFNYPMYSPPTVFPDRNAIDIDHVLEGKNLEILFVDNIFDAYIFHVQGAGSVQTIEKDGSLKKVFLNFAAQNGHPYVSIRKILLDRGIDPKYLTIPGMKKYFALNPNELLPTLVKNPSYVFFKEELRGPMGATNTVLSPGHSIAIDKTVMPLSATALVQTQKPIIENGEVIGWENFSRFAISQDIGGAIRGPGRVDFFWGEDSYAEIAAGTMNQNGSLVFALHKNRLDKK